MTVGLLALAIDGLLPRAAQMAQPPNVSLVGEASNGRLQGKRKLSVIPRTGHSRHRKQVLSHLQKSR
jgi:hypothetical protein